MLLLDFFKFLLTVAVLQLRLKLLSTDFFYNFYTFLLLSFFLDGIYFFVVLLNLLIFLVFLNFL